jgi:hypothetical protein
MDWKGIRFRMLSLADFRPSKFANTENQHQGMLAGTKWWNASFVKQW